jgi:hypothetical protein
MTTNTRLFGENRSLLLVLCVLCFAAYSAMLVGLHDVTFHSVDSVRDVAIARAIADGREFPLVSQPWAAKFQTPPGYAYLLAVPFALGGDERTAFLFVGLLCLLSAAFLGVTLWRCLSPLTATLYAATAMVFPTSVFFHSAGNPSFAFAVSAIAAACLIRVAKGEVTASVPLVFTLFLLPQLHLSSAPFVVAIGIWLLLRPRERVSIAARVIGAIGIVVWAAWIAGFGLFAPEYLATHVAESSILQSLREVGARVLDWQHWYALATTYVRYAQQLVGTPIWITVFVFAIATYMVIGLLVCGWCALRRADDSTERVIFAVTGVSTTASAAYLSEWGVWYFDSWLPWLATTAAIGFARLLASVSMQRTLAVAVLAVFALINVTPQGWLHHRLLSHGYVEISPAGLFGSRTPSLATDPIVVLSARPQLAYRDFIVASSICLDHVVSVAEWYLRDVTRRDGYVDCASSTRAANSPLLELYLTPLRAAGADAVFWQYAPLQLRELPSQTLRMNRAESTSTSVYGNIIQRYGLFLTQARESSITVDIEPIRETQTLVVALRCIPTTEAKEIAWSINGGGTNSLRAVFEYNLLGIQYREFQGLLGASYRRQTMTLDNVKNCDVSAYLR